MDSKEQTTVSVEDINIETLIADPASQDDQKGFFDNLKPENDNFSNLLDEEKPADEQTEKSDIPDKGDDEQKPETKAAENTKNAYIKQLIDNGVIDGFNDDVPIEEYSENDIKDLIESNIQNIRDKAAEEAEKTVFEEMPQEIQAAISYFKQGGTDIKSMLRALSTSREITDFNIDTPEGQKAMIRAYLQSTNYGTSEEIEEEVNSISDRGELEKKANQFKPKLEAMQQRVIQQKMAAQQRADEQRRRAFENYEQSIYDTLKKDDLNGIHTTKKIKNMLYEGMMNADYKLMSGNYTNRLYGLLEKYTAVEPKPDLLCEALWLLSDPDGYRTAVSQSAIKKSNEDTMRKLKTTEQSRETTSNHQEEKRGLQRPIRRGVFD